MSVICKQIQDNNCVLEALSIYVFNDNCLILQRIRSTVDEREQKHLLKELDIVMNSGDCPYIVMFYGALFKEVKATPHMVFCLFFVF